MPATLQLEPGHLIIIRVTDELTVDEFARVNDQLIQQMDQLSSTDILIRLEQFKGWEASDGWEGQSFSDAVDQHIRRMAIVGDPCWKDQALLFTAKGLRPVDIEYFSMVEEEKARRWLLRG